jgi:hypothetical protein
MNVSNVITLAILAIKLVLTGVLHVQELLISKTYNVSPIVLLVIFHPLINVSNAITLAMLVIKLVRMNVLHVQVH